MENPQATVIDVTNLPTLQELERQYLNLVLTKTSGSKAQAAKILGVSIKTVYNKLDVYAAESKESSTTEES
jgi:DNA-binding NtrC family response regulator